MRLGFLLLIGLPGSGKTTFAKYLIKSDSENTHHFIHVCYDDLISFPNGIQEFEWKSARNSVTVKVEKLVIAIKSKNADLCPVEFQSQLTCVECWDCDFIIILDDNMYFRSMRYSVFQIAKKYRIGYCQVLLNCSLDNALLINDSRGPDSTVPSHIIKNMHLKIEHPNNKNNWEKYSIELTSHCNLNEINSKVLPVLNNSLTNFFYEKEESELRELSKIQCNTSVLHQTDLALRKIIGCKIKEYFKENSKKESKDYIAALNLRKSELLSDVKTGNICIPDEILTEINSDALEKFQLINFLGSYF